MRPTTLALLAIIAIAAFALLGRSGGGDAVITVDPTKTYQTMKGWEVSARMWEQNKQEDRYDASWKDYREELFGRLVNELGIDRLRIEIRSGAENPIDYWSAFEQGRIGYEEAKRHRYQNINDNDDPNVANAAGFQFSELNWQVENILLPLKRLVEANGEKLYVNLLYVDFGKYTDKKGDLSHARRPDEYAELIHVTFEHLKRKYGLVPDALEITLEPDNSDEWGGREIGAAAVAAAARLKKAGFSPSIIAPSTARAYNTARYFDRMIEVPGAAGVISTLAYHRYDAGGASKAALSAISQRAKQFRLETAMLEHLAGSTAELHVDLAEVNVSSWQQYGMAYTASAKREREGGYYYLVDVASRKMRMAWRTRDLAQYFKFIRGGAVRIGAASSSADARAVAFRNANGRHVVVVQATRGSMISVRGLPAGSYGVRYTTAAETAQELAAADIGAGQALAARLPAQGTITFYQTGAY